MTNITQDSVTALMSILSDPDFIKLSSRAKQTSLFEFLRLNELNTCAILAWLLDPKEGHDQGEYFLRALVNSLAGADIKVEHAMDIAKFAATSLSGFCCLTEVPISVGESSKRIDLLLIDMESQKAICIERKDGTKASRSQLKSYFDWCKSNYPDWDWLFILSDSYDFEHGQESHDSFIQINDDWLENALDNLIGRKAVPAQVEKIFRELKSFVFGNWNERSDSYYKDFSNIIKRMTKRHKSVLEDISTLYFSYGDRVVEANKNGFYSFGFSDVCGNHIEVLFAKLWFSNLEPLEMLHEYDEFSLIGEYLQDSISTKLEYDAREKYFCLFNGKHNAFDSPHWPYYLVVNRNKVESEGEETVSVRIKIYNSNEEFAKRCEQIGGMYGIKTPDGWNQRSKLLINSIPLRDIENNPDFLDCVKDFLRITDRVR
ncbi:PD-(D/E)XK nuclease family protein [Shewanella submarina]|uniref:PD-(D/E)XK nuclease family protein n=1 Tax=Shewanella submarina TaxID=2016376 RepID=A0ABV7G5L3_9GAMM|nr:PD-(D/E)XK nuclease family protein [Shewanella submarina]MCL1038505.1 PD-(D/E)XK nuclease family protein [Shewanella submarina]